MARFLQENFYIAQILVGGIFLAIAWFFLYPGEPKSNFRVREADLDRFGKKKTDKRGQTEQKLAEAKLQPRLCLTGIRIDGPAHEVLGVSLHATEAQIRTAYRELMKRYHPDAVGRPGSPEWRDAQTISEKINHAKDELLKRLRKS